MGTSTYSLTSNAYIEMRNCRCRRETRNRFLMYSGILALVSVAVTQMIYTVSGTVPLTALIGTLFSTVSCLSLALPEGTAGVGFLSKAAAAIGTAATVLALV